jgi:two-component system response regulator RegA
MPPSHAPWDAFERRGYTVLLAANQEEAAHLKQHQPGYAVVDLKLGGNASGLACVQMLHAHDEAMLIVVLTGFASITTAVEAIKLGACQYLAKPSNTDDIEAAFGHVAGLAEVELLPAPPPSRRWNGNASTRCWWKPISTSPKPPAGSACTAAPWRASWKSSG